MSQDITDDDEAHREGYIFDLTINTVEQTLFI